jgi:hypothetical protein
MEGLGCVEETGGLQLVLSCGGDSKKSVLFLMVHRIESFVIFLSGSAMV